MTNSYRLFTGVALFMVAMAMPVTASAFGALALGEPADIAKSGVALGYTVNYSTKGAAEAEALKERLDSTPRPALRALCKIIRTFENQCIAVAADTQDGTPGFGWSVKTKQAEADSSAMNSCRNTAGPSRQKFCTQSISECDGPPQSK